MTATREGELKLTRRDFFRAAAIGTLTPLLTSGVAVRAGDGYIPSSSLIYQLQNAKITQVVCPYCSVGCLIDLYTDGNKPVWSTGSPGSPINFGTLCPKGKAAQSLIENQLRVTQPLIRTGPKPPVDEILSAKSWDDLVALAKRYPPQWRVATWSEAFDYIARKMSSIMNSYRSSTNAPRQKDGWYYVGNQAPVQLIGSSVMVNEGGYLVSKLAAFLGTSNIDSQYRKCHSSTVSGLALTYGWGAETATLEDIPLASVILIFSNPAEAHPVSAEYFLKAKENGAKVIVFNPTFTRTALLADMWVPFRPGSDVAIFNYILHYAFFERSPPIDQLPEFQDLMKRWNVTQADIDDLKAMLQEYDVNTASTISGVPADTLRTVASLFVENSGVTTGFKKNSIIQWAMGMTQHTNAVVGVIRAAAITQLILGNVGYPGGGTHPFRGHSNVQGVTDVQGGGLGTLPGYVVPPSSAIMVRVYQDWKLQGMPDAWNWEVPDWGVSAVGTSKPAKGQADLAKVLTVYYFTGWRRFELLWGIFIGTDPETDPKNGTVISDLPFGTGYSETTWPRYALNGNIRAAFIFGENPAMSNPDTKVIWAGLASLDLLVVSDIFETETAWFADVLLPAATSFGEQEGTKTNSGRVIQWTYKAVEPKGQARPDYWILANLFKYLYEAGVIVLPSQAFGKPSEKVVFKVAGQITPVYERPLKFLRSWDYSGGVGAAQPVSPIEAEVNPRIINKEINFAVLLYQGMYDPVRDSFLSMRQVSKLRKPGEIDGLFSQSFGVYKDWGYSWPMNVRFMYNLDSLVKKLGKSDTITINGVTYTVTGETGEIIDEYTGAYRPAFIPGHNFWEHRVFKRRLSGQADLFGGLDLIEFIRTNQLVFPGKFVVVKDGAVTILSYEEFARQTGMKYLWANDTLYWDDATASLPATLKRLFFTGGGWKDFKPTYDKMRSMLKTYYEQTRDMKQAILKTISELGGWYKGYSFTWPIHTEPAESPDVNLALQYPSVAWLNPFNLNVLKGWPNVAADKPVGVALTPDDISKIQGELVVITSTRVTEHFHTGAMTRNVPLLVELVPEPFVYLPQELASKLGVKSGDYVEIITARGSVRMRAIVTPGQAVVPINGSKVPVITVTWFGGFQGYSTGPQSNILSPDVVDVVTTIQESKAWIGKVVKAEVM
ncbi:MAG: molybdopterin-dependent oxidoreductase [Infirmifilum sp.]